jgi:hypothetical protein
LNIKAHGRQITTKLFKAQFGALLDGNTEQ